MPPTRREVTALVVAALLAWVVYFAIAHSIVTPAEVTMPAWVPFVPLLTLPYLLQVVVSYLLVFAVRDRALRHATVKAYFLSLSITLAVWFVWPSVMYRPPMPDGWWNWPFRVMATLDLPHNVVPAGHILMPVLICWAFAYERPRWLWWLIPAELAGTVGIVTTWQHRPIDVLYGMALAIAAGLAFGIGPSASRVRARA